MKLVFFCDKCGKNYQKYLLKQQLKLRINRDNAPVCTVYIVDRLLNSQPTQNIMYHGWDARGKWNTEYH